MDNEVLEFAKGIGARDLHAELGNTKLREVFKRPNYFLVDDDKFLIVKISRNKIKPFFGVGKQFIDAFNRFTENNGKNYYFVGLLSNKSGWVLSKHQIMSQISNGSVSHSERENQYKINSHNLKDADFFTTIEDFLRRITSAK